MFCGLIFRFGFGYRLVCFGFSWFVGVVVGVALRVATVMHFVACVCSGLVSLLIWFCLMVDSTLFNFGFDDDCLDLHGNCLGYLFWLFIDLAVVLFD